MPERDLWADMDAWESERDEDDGQDEGHESDGGKAEDGVLGSGLTLEQLAESKDEFVRNFAKGLLDLRVAKAEAAERERLAMQGQVNLEAGNVDFDDPALAPSLLALVEGRRQESDEAFDRQYRLALKARGVPDDLIDAEMAVEHAKDAEVAGWLGAPSLDELPEYREFQLAKSERARAEQAALDMRLREAPGFEADLEAATAEIEAAVEKVLSHG